ncbi:hypothetical protein [Microcella sp.]|uniref:hypothetical protein n=1 Tax=Microcella sp. TaxID=1913979 RepID=UPI00391AA134
MAALMKSNSGTSKGSGFEVDTLFVTRYGTNETLLNRAAAALGFAPKSVKHETVVQRITRAEMNRAQLVKEIADKVLEGIAAGVTVTADANEQAIAAAVEARLADDFQRVEGAIADVPAETVDELGSRLSG